MIFLVVTARRDWTFWLASVAAASRKSPAQTPPHGFDPSPAAEKKTKKNAQISSFVKYPGLIGNIYVLYVSVKSLYGINICPFGCDWNNEYAAKPCQISTKITIKIYTYIRIHEVSSYIIHKSSESLNNKNSMKQKHTQHRGPRELRARVRHLECPQTHKSFVKKHDKTKTKNPSQGWGDKTDMK